MLETIGPQYQNPGQNVDMSIGVEDQQFRILDDAMCKKVSPDYCATKKKKYRRVS